MNGRNNPKAVKGPPAPPRNGRVPSKALQPKMANVPPRAVAPPANPPPIAPPVYRPQPTPRVLQPKAAHGRPTAAPTAARKTPAAPSAYRPQPTPKVLQRKVACAQTATPPCKSSATPARRPAPGAAVQPKAFVASRVIQRVGEKKFGFEAVATDDQDAIAVQQTIERIRQEERVRKQNVESQLSGKLTGNAQSKKDNIELHSTEISNIGLSFKKLKEHNDFTEILSQRGLTLEGKEIKKNDQVVLKFFKGEEAYEKIESANDNGLQRDVYAKRGKGRGPDNQYVKDDKGVFTRRFAYVEKNKYQFRDLVRDGSLRGRYPQDVTSPQGSRPYNEIKDDTAPKLSRTIPSLPKNDTFTDPYQLVYVHQELGSGFQQRGVSASSTGKYAIFSNQGKPFKDKDGFRIKVDLARVPHGTNTEPEVINHYAYDAQKNMQGVTSDYYVETVWYGKNKKQEVFTRPFSHYQWSVRKNREVFIKEVKPEYITALTLHETAKNVPHTVEMNTGFSQEAVIALGKKVGAEHYKQGFIHGRDNLPQTLPLKNKYHKYYQAGHADGKLYAEGYTLGETHRATPFNNLDKDVQKRTFKDIRFGQGFWDAKHDRQKRDW